MRRAMTAVALVVFVLPMMGFGFERIAERQSGLKTQIDELNATKQQLAQDNESCQTSLKEREHELQERMAELEKKDVQTQEQSAAFRQMQTAMKAEIDAKQVTIKELEGKLTLSMVEAILFDSGKATVKKQGKETLKKVAEVLKGVTDQDVVVAGHTDNVQITSKLAETYPTNWGALRRTRHRGGQALGGGRRRSEGSRGLGFWRIPPGCRQQHARGARPESSHGDHPDAQAHVACPPERGRVEAWRLDRVSSKASYGTTCPIPP